jgi:hypothetical protein
MRRLLWTFLTAGAIASGAVVAACGDDDNGSAPPSNTDGGRDGSTTPTADGGAGTPDTGSPDGGACTFAGYVINLINTQTTASAVPTANLGDTCTPSTSQADFASLFP